VFWQLNAPLVYTFVALSVLSFAFLISRRALVQSRFLAVLDSKYG
jgi:hypothetical protein